ncbi:MAG: hypothetical protein IPP72_21330 [Chitinophagaceae bacterium]|nr:hypothetical protein [Chitinophagaceae bacterium]
MIKDSAIIANITEEEGLLNNKIRSYLPVKTSSGLPLQKVSLLSSFLPSTLYTTTLPTLAKMTGFIM